MLLPLHIALFELKRYLTNKGELAFSLALPIAVFALIYGAFGGSESFSATAEVVDLDGGTQARALIDQLDALDEISVKERTLEDANAGLERSAILTALVIPNDFGDSLETDGGATLILKQRGSGGDTGQIVATIARAIADDMARDARIRNRVSAAFAGSEVSQESIDAEVERLLGDARQSSLFDTELEQTGAEDVDVLHRMIPGTLVMFLMFAVTIGAQGMVEERQIGTLERLLTTRLGIGQLFLGKFLASVLRAMVQSVVLMSLAFLVLDIGDIQDFAQVIVFAVLVAAAVSAIGLVIGATARTRDQATWSGVFFTMFMTVFGGTFIDVGSEGVMNLISRVTLNKYAIDSIYGVLSGGEPIWRDTTGIAVMLGVTVVCLSVARALFRASEGGR